MREVGGEETERTLSHEELDHNKFSNLSSIILFEIHLTPEHQGPLKPGASHTISPGRRGGWRWALCGFLAVAYTTPQLFRCLLPSPRIPISLFQS